MTVRSVGQARFTPHLGRNGATEDINLTAFGRILIKCVITKHIFGWYLLYHMDFTKARTTRLVIWLVTYVQLQPYIHFRWTWRLACCEGGFPPLNVTERCSPILPVSYFHLLLYHVLRRYVPILPPIHTGTERWLLAFAWYVFVMDLFSHPADRTFSGSV